jgi:hypothetical protein
MIHDLFAGAGEAAKTSRHTAGRKPEMYDGDRDLCSFETTAVNSVRSIDRDCLTSLHQRFPAECAHPASVPEVRVVIVDGENTSGESKTMPLAVSRSMYQSSPCASIFPENFAPTVLYRLNRWINRFNSNEFFHCLPCEFPHEDEAEYCGQTRKSRQLCEEWLGFGTAKAVITSGAVMVHATTFS